MSFPTNEAYFCQICASQLIKTSDRMFYSPFSNWPPIFVKYRYPVSFEKSTFLLMAEINQLSKKI